MSFSNRKVTLAVAIVLAVAVGILTLLYLNAQKVNTASAPATPQVTLRSVVKTTVDVPVHTKILPQMVSRTQVPADGVDPTAIDDTRLVIGQVSLQPIASGTVVTSLMYGTAASLGLVGRLSAGLRAVTIPVDSVKSVAGLIQPGDRVDVLASVGRVGTRPPTVYTIIRGAKVLAMNDAIEQYGASPAPAGAAAGPSTATLEVTSAQADLLVVADQNTTLRLALRSPEEKINAAPVEPLNLDVPNPVGSLLPAPAEVAKVVRSPKPVPTPHVIVINGDQQGP